jgi:hypothetical protein
MDKAEWIKSLKVGDQVCDCRFQHHTIVSLEEEWRPIWLSPKWMTDWMPVFLFDWCFYAEQWICRKIGRMELIDKTLMLDDGANCSAKHCCDPIDHSPERHPK